jgi:hypothetical protein
MLGLSGRKPAAGRFWEWLDANTRRIQSGLKARGQKISAEIAEAFERSYPDLVWEISVSESGPWLFCVSANGDRALFPRVKQAVAEAPDLPGWRVQAFRPRGALTAEIDMDGRQLGYDDIWCSVEPLDGGIDLTLWIRGLDAESDAALSRAALVLLDNAVGEYDAATRIKQLGRGPLPPGPLEKNTALFPLLFPLADLPRFFDNEESE